MRNDFCSNYLQHSAKGTSWSKKDHKYIKKDGKKYYYKETKTYDDGSVWDKYEDPETGSTIKQNASFKYDPEKYSLGQFVKDLKEDYGAYKDREGLIEEGEQTIAKLLEPKEEPEKDKKLYAKK